MATSFYYHLSCWQFHSPDCSGPKPGSHSFYFLHTPHLISARKSVDSTVKTCLQSDSIPVPLLLTPGPSGCNIEAQWPPCPPKWFISSLHSGSLLSVPQPQRGLPLRVLLLNTPDDSPSFYDGKAHLRALTVAHDITAHLPDPRPALCSPTSSFMLPQPHWPFVGSLLPHWLGCPQPGMHFPPTSFQWGLPSPPM